MLVLFLDIDGVLITRASTMYYRWLEKMDPDSDKGWRKWCPIATNNLRELLEAIPDLKIVMSSSWRTGRTVTECADLLEENGIDRTRLIDRTGQTIDGRVRGLEIQEWLDVHPEVDRFVIVDDDKDMAHLRERLVRTEFSVGLTMPQCDQIKKLLETSVPV